jgi:hypothetical protein
VRIHDGKGVALRPKPHQPLHIVVDIFAPCVVEPAVVDRSICFSSSVIGMSCWLDGRDVLTAAKKAHPAASDLSV